MTSVFSSRSVSIVSCKPKRRPPWEFKAARSGKVGLWLSHDPVSPFARLALRRLDLQLHLLSDLRAEESPDAVVLPVGRFRDLGNRRALVPAKLDSS